ncbi:MAG: LemA family protein [Deltaproteobacteria bacterium]|nr:LemA family protein [Deltaproteobacteria bacterium]
MEWLILAVIVILILWLALAYNGLVRLKNQVDNAWSQIDVQLKRRHDLIPNLVETVKGYMKYEQETLNKVIEARAKAMGAQTVKDVAQAENMLTGALKSLFALAENYPDLKANQNVQSLMEELTSTENKIAFSRQFYNDQTMEYNVRIESVPTNVVASLFNFKKRDFFEVAAPEEREVVKVQF